MGPVELLFISIALTVTLIGLARGYAKELGSTLIILVAIFILAFFDTQITALTKVIASRLLGVTNDASVNALLSLVYSVAFIAIAFAGYAGRTLTFTGQPAPPPEGALLTLLIGALNGYLIAGTLWYYQDVYKYPIGQFVEFNNQLTDRAQVLVKYLPQHVFPNPVYWIVPVAFLLLIRVRG